MFDRLKISARALFDEVTAHRMTLGRTLYLAQSKFGDGLRTAYYRDIVRPWILDTPPIEETNDTRCEIHSLVSNDDWLNLLWSLKSFYHCSGRRYSLCIHDDGTLTAAARDNLRSAFPRARLIPRSEADPKLAAALASSPRSREFRAVNKFALKLFDFHAFLEADHLLMLDSDVLFFDAPSALLALADDVSSRVNSFNKDWRNGYSIDPETLRPFLDFAVPPLINAGLGVVHPDSLRADWIEEFLELPGITSLSHQIEQTIVALCSGRFGFQMLPAEYDVHLGPRDRTAPSRHYTGPLRPLMYREGIRELVRKGILSASEKQRRADEGASADSLRLQ